MAQIVVSGDTSGSCTLVAPAVAGGSVLTLPVATDTLVGKATTDVLTNKTLTSPVIAGTPSGVGTLTSGTAVASTSGTSIDFTGIPSWVKRITVMFNGVSANGTSVLRVQLGVSGTPETTGYTGTTGLIGSSGAGAVNISTGFEIGYSSAAAELKSGTMVLTNVSGNIWVCNSTFGFSGGIGLLITGGVKTLASVLNMVRITTANGTVLFDAGSINIMYE